MIETNHLIVDHIPRLRRYARSLVWEPALADDLVQDTLERAWSKFFLWKSGSDLRAWLFTIMHNVHANNVRTNSSTYFPQSQDLDEVDIPVRATQEDGLQVRDIQLALNGLPLEQREVVLLVGLEDMHYEEVAKVLSVPVGTVMSRLSRGRENLRRIMAGKTIQELRVVK